MLRCWGFFWAVVFAAVDCFCRLNASLCVYVWVAGKRMDCGRVFGRRGIVVTALTAQSDR